MSFFFVCCVCFFFFNDTATTEIYTLSLHDALPISCRPGWFRSGAAPGRRNRRPRDRKSTRLNSSHITISYAVFCLKKKKTDCSTCCLAYTLIGPAILRARVYAFARDEHAR